MFIPYDPILSLFLVVGVFIYFALKGNKSSSSKIKEEESCAEIFKRMKEKQEQENEKYYYQRWLEDHQQ